MRWAVVACALVACAHTPDLALRPDPSPPPGSTTETIRARDGTQLLARRWAVAEGEPRAVVVIMHGLKDHSARYAAFAQRLVGAGYTVYAFDLRGHGRSAGKRVAPDDWDDYVDDLDRFLATVQARHPVRQVYVFGHSMGGAIATAAAIRHFPPVSGLILSAPALAIDAPPLLIAATRMAGVLSPRAPALKLDNDKFSSDPHAAKQIADDPLISQPPGPARTAAGLVEGMHYIWSHTDRLAMPVLALHGTRDQLTAPSGSRALIRAVTRGTLKIYPNLAHDLLHEPTGRQVEDDIVAWLDARTDGVAEAPAPLHEGHLGGDPRGWTQAIEATGGIVTRDGEIDASGSFALHLARPRPIGWHGALTARLAGAYRTVALHPLGVAGRFGAVVTGISVGAAFVTGKDFTASGGAWIEAPLGPLHGGVTFEFARKFVDVPERGPLGTDLLWTTLSLRLGGDRGYWPHAVAGVGPVVSGGAAWLGDEHAWVVTAGLQLYGAD